MYYIVTVKIPYYMLIGNSCILGIMVSYIWGQANGLTFGKIGKRYIFVLKFLFKFEVILCFIILFRKIHPFDKIDNFLLLKFTDKEYVYDYSNLYKKEGVDYICYVDASAKGKELSELLNKILKKEDFYVEYDIDKGYYCIKNNGINYGNIVVERKGLLKKVSVKWDNEKLKQRESGF